MSEWRCTANAGDDTWESGNHNRELAIIWPLLGRHIAFHRRLVDLTESVKAALLLSQTIYWTRHGRDVARTGGWFLKTTEQWEMETGLSAKEQITAREVLRELAILNEQRIGIPAKLHFRLCVDQLGGMLANRIGKASAPLDWADGAAVAELLGPSLAYHRTLAGIGGGVHAGLLLSRALYLTRLQVKRQLDAWVRNSAARWTQDLGLTRREQETARRDLERAGVWEEALIGIPRSLVARIRMDCLLALLAGDESGSGQPVAAHDLPGCGIPAHRLSHNGESSLRDTHILVPPKAPDQIHQNRHHSFAESANLHIQRSTSDSVQPLSAAEARRDAGRSQSGGDLIFPDALLPEERVAALRLIRRCEDQAQALLDELSGRMQARAVRTSPIAYLRGLVNRAIAGQFVPELAPRVAAARRRRQEELVQRQEREAEDKRLAAERATPEYKARAAARREEIRRMLDLMRTRPQSGKRP
ncbi:MAG: hypothetical protein KJZ83_09545 [Burkholderiaceae bacterium]|nr:hypothetical protein [Burkholderiaceae bacterium]